MTATESLGRDPLRSALSLVKVGDPAGQDRMTDWPIDDSKLRSEDTLV